MNMRGINISNIKNRNATVGLDLKSAHKGYSLVHNSGKPHKNIRLLKHTVHTGVIPLKAKHGEDLATAIIHSDIEVDMEKAGMLLDATKKIYVDHQDRPAFRITRRQLFHSPNNEMEMKELHIPEANINIEIPLRCTGKLIPREKAVRSFVFARNYQIRHTNGLTYDFLFEMAKNLSDADSMMLVGAGSSGKSPVVMSTGGTPYRAFLEGRVRGNQYCLILHLTNLELKNPSTIS